jgi:competence protein ComEA
MLLPGIGPHVSRGIIDYRERCAPRPAFKTVEELDCVRGIGPATIARLRPYLRIGPAPTAREHSW